MRRPLDYIIVDDTGAHWPGCLPYCSRSTPRGKGYRTWEAAYARLQAVNNHYNRTHGCSPGALRVVERPRRS